MTVNYLKTINKFFWASVFVLFCLTSAKYQGQWYVYVLFSIVLNVLLFLGFRKGRVFFDTFIGVFFWLGYWLKFSVRVAFFNGKFHEPTGSFSYTGSSFDHALLVTTCGALALIVVSLLRGRYLFTYNEVCKDQPLKGLLYYYNKYRHKVWLAFFILVIGITFTNFHFVIYQRGTVPKTILPYGLNSVYTWLLLFGMASFSSLILEFEFRENRKNSFVVVLLSFFECFFSSISLLSRGMILNGSSLLLGLTRSITKKSPYFSFRFLVKTLATFCILFVFSVLIVNFIRTHTFSGIDFMGESGVSVRQVVSKTKVLFIDRWVGIEGIMAVSSCPELGWDLWKEAWNEKFKNNGTSYYDLNIITKSYTGYDLAKHHFVSLPGIMAFFFYPGSFVFLFLAMLLLGAVGAGIEILVYKAGRNPILCSLLAQVVAYRYAHFGYAPKHSYVLFGALFFNVLAIYFADKVCSRFERYMEGNGG